MINKLLPVLLVVLSVCFIFSLSMPAARAHRVHVSYRVEEIEVKAWYGGGEPMKNAHIKVFTLENMGGELREELYREGRLDENGCFTFAPIVGVENYRAVVESTGHRGEIKIVLDETASGGGGEGGRVIPPSWMRIIGGLGYLLGLAGAGMAYVGWKWKRNYEEEGGVDH